MARIIGKVDDGSENPPKYFIHCDTVGTSFSPLFEDGGAAWSAYDANGVDSMYEAVPKRNIDIRVVRKVLAFGREFEPSGKIYGKPEFDLATADRLLDFGGSFLQIEGEMHLASSVDHGFGDQYNAPICDKDHQYNDEDVIYSLGELFNKPLNLCPHCIAKILGL